MKKENKILRPLFKSEECILPIDTPKEKKPSQLIIIGSGASVKEGIDKGLWDKIKDKYTIGMNFSYNYFKSTLQTYVDIDFYSNNWNDLENLPLLIGKYHKDIEKEIRGNTIMLITSSKYNRNLENGVYKSSLCGLFSLSLGIHLLNKGEIFLIGFDYGSINKKDKNNRLITHFYQGDIHHRGIGKINYYQTKGRADRDFGVYSSEKQCKIYTVGLKSKINTFPKISYDKFFSMLDSYTYDKNKLREHIRNKLKKKNVNKS